MKTSIKSFAAMCAIYFLASGLAMAEPADVFITADGCSILDDTGEVWFVTDRRQVSANSTNNNVMISCTYDLEHKTITGRSVIYNYDNTGGALCTTSAGPTDNWHQVISASGKVKLTCHYQE